jgi:hypothetical protein
MNILIPKKIEEFHTVFFSIRPLLHVAQYKSISALASMFRFVSVFLVASVSGIIKPKFWKHL